MRHIDLFSGIGGFALAATWVWRDEYENVGHSEIEKYPCKVYHNHFPQSECLGDITKIDWTRFAGTIDLVTGGFPCQPHSVAGKRKGSGDERDLWAECVRAIREIRPRFALFENVSGIFSSNGGQFFERVLSDISESGYDCEWQVLSAAEVGAWHRRERVWIICTPNSENLRWPSIERHESDGILSVVPNPTLRQDDGRSGRNLAEAASGRESIDTTVDAGGQDVSDAINAKTARQRIDSGKVYAESEPERLSERCCLERWATEPCLGELADGLSIDLDLADRERAIRVATGVPRRVDQLKGLGNAIVPQCAAVIMQKIKENM